MHQINTPVVLVIFNRPDVTQLIFSEIAKAKPPVLLVVADGARTGKPNEKDLCLAARSVVDQVNWDCEVLMNFSEANLGCKVRVSSGLDWVFSKVDRAIILEDDCLPDQTFFRYCEEMLDRYSDDKRVGSICGSSFQFEQFESHGSYFFTKYGGIWGWATWRDRWSAYDVSMARWPAVRDGGWLKDLIGRDTRRWSKLFEAVHSGKIDTWDYQWVFTNWIEGRLVIVPSVNLVSNIGFGENATHTTRKNNLSDMKRYTLQFPLIHPPGVFRSSRKDELFERSVIRSAFLRRVWNKIF